MSSRSTVSVSRLLIALVVAALAMTALPAAAVAKKRVVILDFSGSRASRFESQVKAIVKRRASLISARRYVKTARKIKATQPTKRNIVRVSRELSADAIIIGSVKRRGRRYQVTIRVRAGADGEFVETIKVRTRRAKLTGAALRKVRRELAAAIKRLPPLNEPVDDGGGFDDGDDEIGEDAIGDDDDDIIEEDVGDDDRVAERGDDDDGDRVEEERGDDDGAADLTDERKADLLARGRGLEVLGGLSVMRRNLSFTVSADLGMESPRGYSGTPVASAYILGELYPLAFNLKNKGYKRNIGVVGILDRVIKIESKLRYVDAMMEEQEATLPTEQQRWGIGLIYRHNFGSKPTSPTIKLALRYNRAKFIIDKTAAPAGVDVDIPNMDYAYYDPGLVLRYPVSPKVALQADARFLLVTDTGEMQQVDQYGGATVTGYDIDLGGDYKLDARLFVRVGFRAIGIAYDFKGTGAETTDRDGDPNDQDVFGALDRYLGGYGTIGYLF
jgi:hypothetical protein